MTFRERLRDTFLRRGSNSRERGGVSRNYEVGGNYSIISNLDPEI